MHCCSAPLSLNVLLRSASLCYSLSNVPSAVVHFPVHLSSAALLCSVLTRCAVLIDCDRSCIQSLTFVLFQKHLHRFKTIATMTVNAIETTTTETMTETSNTETPKTKTTTSKATKNTSTMHANSNTNTTTASACLASMLARGHTCVHTYTLACNGGRCIHARRWNRALGW